MTGTYRLYVMSADGTGLTALADSARWPAWSPDGASIAYVRNRRVRVTDGIVDIEPDRGTMPARWRPESGNALTRSAYGPWCPPAPRATRLARARLARHVA